MNEATTPASHEARRPPAAPAAPPALMTLREIAAYTQVGLRTLHRWKSSGKFPPPDLSQGKVQRWRRDTVDAWICPECGQHAPKWGRAET
jgi:excisionase family DNA binding protein